MPIPAPNASAVISPAYPADSDWALVTSSGSTTIARDAVPKTNGAAGATPSQNALVRSGAGGAAGRAWRGPAATARSVRAGPPAGSAPDGAAPDGTAFDEARDEITGCDRAGRGDAGAVRPTARAAAPSARCGRYGTTSGSPAHCASSAATTGPSPNPALSASAARRALTASPADRSSTQAVAGPKTIPEHRPARARPAASSARSCGPSMSSSVATGDRAANGSTQARRPTRSESAPPSSSPGISVAA